MAIQVGSGGLKYPLLNRAQIQAQQNAAAASAGGSASASAYGANLRYAGLKKQLQYNAFESGMDRAFRAQQSYFDREHEMGGQLEAQRSAAERQAAQFEQQTQLQLGQQGFNADQAELDRDFTAQRDTAQFARDQTQYERDIDAQIEADMRSGKLTLPPAAQRRLDELEATKSSREAQGLDPQQRAEFEQAYEHERRKVLRQAQAPAGPSATGQANSGQTFYDPQTGTFFDEMSPGRIPGSVNKEGRFEPTVAAPAGPDPKDMQRQRAEDEKQARDYMGQVNPSTGKPYTREQAIEQVQADREAFDQAFGPQQPEQAGDIAGGGSAPPATRAEPQVAAPSDRPMGMGESVQARSSLAPEQEGLPQGVPEGSSWVNEDTVRYPDGRMFRRKSEAGQSPSSQSVIEKWKAWGSVGEDITATDLVKYMDELIAEFESKANLSPDEKRQLGIVKRDRQQLQQGG